MKVTVTIERSEGIVEIEKLRNLKNDISLQIADLKIDGLTLNMVNLDSMIGSKYIEIQMVK